MKNLFLVLIVIIVVGCNSTILDDPSTTIPFSLPSPSHVKISVENSYNTIIAILVDQDLPAGVHQTNFDISNLAEGIYFYTIEITPEDGSPIKMVKNLLLIK